MAKQAATTSQAKPSNNQPLVPIATDPRTELFFLIGKAGYECSPQMASRIMELTVVITTPTAAPTSTEAE